MVKGKSYVVYEEDGILYRINEDKKIEFCEVNILGSCELGGETHDGEHINMIENLKDEIDLSNEGFIEYIRRIKLFATVKSLFVDNEDR